MKNVLIVNMEATNVRFHNLHIGSSRTVEPNVTIVDPFINMKAHNCWYLYPSFGEDVGSWKFLYHIEKYESVGEESTNIFLGNSFKLKFEPQIDRSRGFLYGKSFFFLPLLDFGFIETTNGVLNCIDIKDLLVRVRKIRTLPSRNVLNVA